MKRFVPAPLSSGALLALWLVLAGSTSPGQVLMGLVLALVVPLMTANLRPATVRVARPWGIVRFVLLVAYDVVRANIGIAWDLFVWRWRRPRSRFVVIPLDLRDPLGLAVLAMVTTIVPGTVWSELALDRSALMLHAWDVDDEDAFIARYKFRYEQPIREIFE